MGLEFIKRIIRTTLILAVLIAVFGSVYHDWHWSLGILVGACWGCANLFFIKNIIISVLTPNEKNSLLALLLSLVKFPVLYFLGYLALASGYFTTVSLLIGFTLIFTVALLKALGRLIMGLDKLGFEKKRTEGNS